MSRNLPYSGLRFDRLSKGRALFSQDNDKRAATSRYYSSPSNCLWSFLFRSLPHTRRKSISVHHNWRNVLRERERGQESSATTNSPVTRSNGTNCSLMLSQTILIFIPHTNKCILHAYKRYICSYCEFK